MALRVSTTTRFCLNCKVNSIANAGKDFHEIFDEMGLELQLPFLVKTFFHIDLNKEDKQHLCDDCVNRLIELYDLDEHTKEESCKPNNLKNMPECSNNQIRRKYFKTESGNFTNERENIHKPFVNYQKKIQVTLPKSNIECKNFEISVSTQGGNTLEMNKQNKSECIDSMEYENINNISVRLTHKQNQSSIDIAEDLPDEDFCQPGERKVSQDFNISLSSSAINDKKSDKLESNELMEFIIDDGNQNVKINKQSNANTIVGSKKLEIEEYQIKSNEEIEVLSEVKSEIKENVVLYSDSENEFVEENVCEEFINSGDSSSLQGELKISEEKEALLNASNSATEFNNIEHIDADDFIEHDKISDDTYSVEEEYLADEIILTETYDQVDLNDYLDKVLITKFQDLLLNWEMECKLCLRKYYSFAELLNHECMAELEKKQQLSCIIKDCEEHAKDLQTLARHLVLKHYDKLESIAIYGKCPDCKKTFSNVLKFNKHSCCRNIKRITGTPNYCKYCDLDFQSFKRFVFHMQFHLKNHRPKICLLCGDLFSNFKDFFEHTQYKHNLKTALTCVRCDIFFKEIQIFNNHMELHDDSKYQYECAICPKKYTSKVGLNQHMDICHNNKPNVLQCEFCPKKFAYKNSYLNHIKTHTADAKVKTFICSTCGLITNNMEMIKEHIESDNESLCFSSPVDEKILGLGYSCENCSLDFCTIKHLKDHRLSDSHSDDLFHCGKCRKSFSTLHHMRNHSIKHKECKAREESFPITRRFVCNIGDCQEFYTIWRSLQQHKTRSHKTEEKINSPIEFKCQFCQQLLSSKKILIDHVARIHHSANFKCSPCNKKFYSQNMLQTHIDKFHTPVECDICLKKFERRRYLETHMDCVHIKVKRFFCKHCQKGYFHKSRRNYHEEKTHPEL